jgi:hypothetical protein
MLIGKIFQHWDMRTNTYNSPKVLYVNSKHIDIMSGDILTVSDCDACESESCETNTYVCGQSGNLITSQRKLDERIINSTKLHIICPYGDGRIAEVKLIVLDARRPTERPIGKLLEGGGLVM